MADKIATDRIIGTLVDFGAFPVMLFSYVIWFFLTCYEVVAVLGTRFHFASKIPVLTHHAILYIVQLIFLGGGTVSKFSWLQLLLSLSHLSFDISFGWLQNNFKIHN